MNISNDKENTSLKLEIAAVETQNEVLRIQMYIAIADRISIKCGGIANLPNAREHIRLLATELMQADPMELYEIFRKIVTD